MSRKLNRRMLHGPAGFLEALHVVPEAPCRGAALLCHPHPLHGGSMHTKALHHAARGLEDAGFAVLRFNFRGVGRSGGRFGGGDGEVEDARVALEFLTHEHPGQPCIVGGFSFGSWVALRLVAASPPARLHGLVALGLPLRNYDFDFVTTWGRPLLVVVGDHDPFCPRGPLQAWSRRLTPPARVVVLPATGHLLTENLHGVREAVRTFALAPEGTTPPAPGAS